MPEQSAKAQSVCQCPFCDEELQEEMAPFCQGCGAKIEYCSACHAPIDKETGKCPTCGKPARR